VSKVIRQGATLLYHPDESCVGWGVQTPPG